MNNVQPMKQNKETDSDSIVVMDDRTMDNRQGGLLIATLIEHLKGKNRKGTCS